MRLATLLQGVAPCCVVGSNLKMVKFFMQHFWMLHDVAVFWPGLSKMLYPGMRNSSIFNTQHVATRRNTVAKRTQHVPPNNVAICCIEMLRSFDRSLQMLGQQCFFFLFHLLLSIIVSIFLHTALTIITILTNLTLLTILSLFTSTDYITPTFLTILSCNYLILQTI